MQECQRQECLRQECQTQEYTARLYFESFIFAFVHFCIRAFVRAFVGGALAPPV